MATFSYSLHAGISRGQLKNYRPPECPVTAKLFGVTWSTAKMLPGTEPEMAKETGAVAEKNIQQT